VSTLSFKKTELIISIITGFLFANAPTSLSPSDFQDDEKMKEKYLPECEA